MNDIQLADVDTVNTVLFSLVILLVFMLFCGIFFFGIWLNRRPLSVSPYSRLPMRRGSDLSYYAAEKLLRFLYETHQYDNRIISLKRAAVCRETGRVFSNAVTWYDKIELDWTFLQKRYPGAYVSWGSLSPEQQESIRNIHDSLEGFQTGFSSPNPAPKAIEAKYALAKPGPLYVDINTKVLLGWKCIPNTDLEVLIVQKPKYVIKLSIE